MWPIEHIPNGQRLFLRVHANNLVPDGNLHPGIFREHKGSMSVDWEKYTTPSEARRRAKRPSLNGIVMLTSDGVRSVDELDVKHEPDEDRSNRAHAGVYGIYDPNAPDPEVRQTMIRSELFKLFNQWQISPNEPVESPIASSGRSFLSILGVCIKWLISTLTKSFNVVHALGRLQKRK